MYTFSPANLPVVSSFHRSSGGKFILLYSTLEGGGTSGRIITGGFCDCSDSSVRSLTIWEKTESKIMKINGHKKSGEKIILEDNEFFKESIHFKVIV